MRYELAKLHQDLKTTMIYVTHDQVEAMTLAKRIVVMSSGRIEQVGTPMELYNDPDNIFVAGFIGSPRMNFLDAEIESIAPRRAVLRLPSGDTIAAAVDTRSARPGQRVTLGIRPEHFDARAKSNVLPVKVRFVERLGSVTIAYGNVAKTETEVIVQLPGDFEVGPGETILPGPAPHACYLFDDNGRAFLRLTEDIPVAALPGGIG
jgi:multiple sugar transport system ATP-binding protein